METPYRVRATEITMLVQATLIGFLLGELWYLAQAVSTPLNTYIQSSSTQGVALITCGLTSTIGIAYFFIRDGLSDAARLWRANRVDLLALTSMVVLGLSISVSMGGVGSLKYQEYVGKASILLLILLVAVPVVIALMLELKVFSKFMLSLKRDSRDKPTSFFLNDQDIKFAEDDLLGSNVKASMFAERVLNGGSTDSLVFGIDAPWGIGKSSFVNFCCEYWKTNVGSRTIVHRFEPLRYKESADLVDEFVNELANKIQQHAFSPSIRTLFSRYLHLIKGENELSFFGIKWDLATSASTVQETLDNLEALLIELDRKIIIVVDDLDRLSWTEVKNILFAIKRSFMLPNVSYVLCYDTENLSSQSNDFDDVEKVREFLEKFVNVKVSLFLDSTVLANYVSANFELAVKNNRQIDRYTHDKIKEALDGLIAIYNSNEFFLYQELLGDIRKLKRLINTLILLEIDQTDFANSDFNKIDIVHLLLVYINFPSIFRKIYNAETNGKAGFFSLSYRHIDTNSRFENSSRYKTYLETLSDTQRFLLDKVFHVGVLALNKSVESMEAQTISMTEKKSRACFNGQGGSSRNLERYLYLIAKQSKQSRLDAYQFYVRQKDQLVQGLPLEIIFHSDDFNFSKGDFARDQLWRIILNSTIEIKPDIAGQVVAYLIDHLPDYSLLEAEDIGAGSRDRLIYSLLKLLDEASWGRGLSGQRNDNVKNISEIADWVFGENSHADAGVLDTLSKAERGPLGLFDLLLFRLYCSPDRENSLFNLQRAIALHGNAPAPTSGTVELAKEGMREISQAVFKVFLKQYIEPKVNLFEAVDRLSLNHFAGESAKFVGRQIEAGTVRQQQVDELIAAEKTRVKVFIIYQLGNSMISSGVGCGYYDETGKRDEKGIAVRINEYLFDECFNPATGPNNVEHFLDYLLMNFSHSFDARDGLNHEPNVDEFTKVIDRERLKVYWRAHRSEILDAKLPEKEKSVSTANYVVTYEKGLPAVYRVLDGLLGVSTDSN